MTTHTYKCTWIHDTEAESPVDAARAFVQRADNTSSLSHAPIMHVDQFVDTDKPPIRYDVDTYDWEVTEVHGIGQMVYMVVHIHVGGGIGEAHAFLHAHPARALLVEKMLEYVREQTGDDSITCDVDSCDEYNTLARSYDEWQSEDGDIDRWRLIEEQA